MGINALDLFFCSQGIKEFNQMIQNDEIFSLELFVNRSFSVECFSFIGNEIVVKINVFNMNCSHSMWHCAIMKMYITSILISNKTFQDRIDNVFIGKKC